MTTKDILVAVRAREKYKVSTLLAIIYDLMVENRRLSKMLPKRDT